MEDESLHNLIKRKERRTRGKQVSGQEVYLVPHIQNQLNKLNAAMEPGARGAEHRAW